MNAHFRDKTNPFKDGITEQDLFDAERDVIAAILIDNEKLKLSGLIGSDFAEDLHKLIFGSFERLAKTGQRITVISVKPDLPKMLQGLEMTPAEYLTSLVSQGYRGTLPERFQEAIEIIKRVSMSRHVGAVGGFLSSLGQETYDVFTVADEVENSIQQLKSLNGRFTSRKSFITPGSAYLDAFDKSAKAKGVIGVPIALPEIQRVIGEKSFEAGNLYGLLSSSGEGKTSLTIQLINHALDFNHPVLFLSYDQSSEQIVRQMIAQRYGIEARRQREPNELMNDADRDKCVVFASELERKPFQIIRCTKENAVQLTAYARQFCRDYGNGLTPFIVADHIGKITKMDAKADAGKQSGEVTGEFTALGGEVQPDGTKATTLMLCQRNEFGTRRDNPRPIESDLYGGQGAKADYDAVIYLYRPAKYKANREAIAATESDWKKIHRVFGQFGDDIEMVAELGAIKCRFSNPNVRELVDFNAKYTVYTSRTPPRDQERML